MIRLITAISIILFVGLPQIPSAKAMPYPAHSTLGGGSPENNRDHRHHLSTARWFKDKGYLDVAEQHYLVALEINPTDYSSNKELGELYYHHFHNVEEAIKYLSNAIKYGTVEDYGFRELHVILGEAHHFVSNYTQAIKWFKKARVLLAGEKATADVQASIYKSMRECRLGLAEERLNGLSDIYISNMGPAVNSKYDDYLPVFIDSGNTMLFTSRRSKAPVLTSVSLPVKEDEDIYYASVQNRAFSDATILDTLNTSLANLDNSKGHEAAIGLARNNLMYTCRNGKIYESERRKYSLTEPVPVRGSINKGLHQSHASVTADGKYMFFSSEREGGEGKMDIYMAVRQYDGSWGAAQNLGMFVNTPMDEISPEISADGFTLYFSSEGHEGIGGFDVYKSEFRKGRWQKPINMGMPINSSADDVYYRDEITKAYLSSSRSGGCGQMDIYEIEFNAQPTFTNCKGSNNELELVAMLNDGYGWNMAVVADTIGIGDPVRFELGLNGSESIRSYHWKFDGDSAVDRITKPSHIFKTPGKKRVSLEYFATGKDGKSIRQCVYKDLLVLTATPYYWHMVGRSQGGARGLEIKTDNQDTEPIASSILTGADGISNNARTSSEAPIHDSPIPSTHKKISITYKPLSADNLQEELDFEKYLRSMKKSKELVEHPTPATGYHAGTPYSSIGFESGKVYTFSKPVEHNLFTSSGTPQLLPKDKLPAGLCLKIQVGAFKKHLTPAYFKGYGPVTAEPTSKGVSKYTIGVFYSMQSARKALAKLKSSGFPDSFIVAYFNGARIPEKIVKSSQVVKRDKGGRNAP